MPQQTRERRNTDKEILAQLEAITAQLDKMHQVEHADKDDKTNAQAEQTVIHYQV